MTREEFETVAQEFQANVTYRTAQVVTVFGKHGEISLTFAADVLPIHAAHMLASAEQLVGRVI